MNTNNKFSKDRCNFGSISFQMLSEVLRARSFSILEAIQGDSVDISHVKRLATHMSLSADDLVSATGLTNSGSEFSSELHCTGAGKKPEPSSLASVLELSRIASERRFKERSLQLCFETLSHDHFISGNPWEVAWVVFFLLTQVSSPRSSQVTQSDEIRVSLVSRENLVDLSVTSTLPLKSIDSPTDEKAEKTLLSELEWFCLDNILNKNNLYFIQKQVVNYDGKKAFYLTLRVPTFQPGFE